MQANWSLILNVLLLVGVGVAIRRVMKARRQLSDLSFRQPSLGAVETPNYDDIIAVRKLDRDVSEDTDDDVCISPIRENSIDSIASMGIVGNLADKIRGRYVEDDEVEQEPLRVQVQSFQEEKPATSSLMMFLLAKENRQLAGYELLQTVLSVGLRYGDGSLFHRHQFPNGQGPVLCSLAAATAAGTFDLQNIGAFSVRGLCLFMQASGNSTIDAERFTIMLDTAKQLSEGLDAHLLDDQRQPFCDISLQRYRRHLNIEDIELAVVG